MTHLSSLPQLATGALCALTLAACSSTQTYMSDNTCLSMANALQTLRMGDELPRVIQVMGPPTHTYRARPTAFLSKSYEVLTYDTTGTACGRILLDSPEGVHLMFNEQGRLISMGNQKFFSLQKTTNVTTKPFNSSLRRVR